MDVLSPFLWGPIISGLVAFLVIIVLTPFFGATASHGYS